MDPTPGLGVQSRDTGGKQPALARPSMKTVTSGKASCQKKKVKGIFRENSEASTEFSDNSSWL